MTSAGTTTPGDTPQGLPRGVRLGVDVGDVRVGVARSDLDGLIATPVETVLRDLAVARVLAEAQDASARVVMVGLPRSLSGQEGAAAGKARAFCAELIAMLSRTGLDTEVRLLDERLTTVSAHRALHDSGRRGRKHRQVVDQVAAVMILQQALDVERATGARAGELVVGDPADDPDDTPAPPAPGTQQEDSA